MLDALLTAVKTPELGAAVGSLMIWKSGFTTGCALHWVRGRWRARS
ncbi:MAG: hypothetical protein AAF192_08695 [Pseudomonadota bacterium]